MMLQLVLLTFESRRHAGSAVVVSEGALVRLREAARNPVAESGQSKRRLPGRYPTLLRAPRAI